MFGSLPWMCHKMLLIFIDCSRLLTRYNFNFLKMNNSACEPEFHTNYCYFLTDWTNTALYYFPFLGMASTMKLWLCLLQATIKLFIVCCINVLQFVLMNIFSHCIFSQVATNLKQSTRWLTCISTLQGANSPTSFNYQRKPFNNCTPMLHDVSQATALWK